MISCKVNLYTVICEKGVILCGVIEIFLGIESIDIVGVDIGLADVVAGNVVSSF